MERPKTPGLHDSTLQYGDVQRLEQAQRIAGMPRTQPPSTGGASPSTPGSGQPPTGGGISVPDPVEFAKSRLGGTLRGRSAGPQSPANVKGWLPVIRSIANAPGASGTLRGAMLTQLSAMVNNPAVPQSTVLDMDDLDRDLQGLANDL